LLRLTKTKKQGLELHLATESRDRSGQSGAQEQQGSWLRRGAAAAATEDLEGALIGDAVGKPRLTTVGGVVFSACSAVAKVEGVIRIVAATGWAKHQPVNGTGAEAEPRNTCDGDQAAARTERCTAGEVVKRGQHRSRLTTVVGVDVEIERISKARHIANGKINLAGAAASRHLKLVSSGKTGPDATCTGDSPSRAAVVNGAS